MGGCLLGAQVWALGSRERNASRKPGPGAADSLRGPAGVRQRPRAASCCVYIGWDGDMVARAIERASSLSDADVHYIHLTVNILHV